MPTCTSNGIKAHVAASLALPAGRGSSGPRVTVRARPSTAPDPRRLSGRPAVIVVDSDSVAEDARSALGNGYVLRRVHRGDVSLFRPRRARARSGSRPRVSRPTPGSCASASSRRSGDGRATTSSSRQSRGSPRSTLSPPTSSAARWYETAGSAIARGAPGERGKAGPRRDRGIHRARRGRSGGPARPWTSWCTRARTWSPSGW